MTIDASINRRRLFHYDRGIRATMITNRAVIIRIHLANTAVINIMMTTYLLPLIIVTKPRIAFCPYDVS